MNFFPESQNTPMPPQQDLDFFEQVIGAAETSLNYGILTKANEIPIIFVSDETMSEASQNLVEAMFQEEKNNTELFEKWQRDHNCPDAEIWQYEGWLRDYLWSRVDFLGFFVSDKTIRRNGPEVWVCYDKICKYNYDSTVCRNTTLEVLIHELGHAVMYNSLTTGIFSLNEWVEEPLANMIALKYISTAMSSAQTDGDRQVLQDALESSRSSMGRQSPNYRLGLNLFDAEQNGITFNWKEWLNCKNYLNQKKKELLAWRAYVEKSRHSYVNQAQLDPAKLYALYQEIVKPVQNEQQLLTQGNNDNMGNDLSSLIYYVFFAVRHGAVIDPTQDYHDTLAAYEQGTKDQYDDRDFVDLANINRSQAEFEEIYDQIANQGRRPNQVAVTRRGVVTVQPPAVSYFEKYLNGTCQGENTTRTSVEATYQRIQSILNGRTENLVDENGIPYTVNHPARTRMNGLVVGRVQSGKTRNYIGLMLKAFDEGYNTIIVLTSSNVELASQTEKRIVREFNAVGINQTINLQIVKHPDNGGVQWAPSANTALQHKFLYWGVVIKEAKNMEYLLTWLNGCHYLNNMRIMLIDDEADNATPNSKARNDLYTEEQLEDILDELRDEANEEVATNGASELTFLVDWYDYLLQLPDDHRAADLSTDLIASAGASYKRQMGRLFTDTEWRNVVDFNDDIQHAIYGYYNARTNPTYSEFIKIVSSILEIKKDRSAINAGIISIVDKANGQANYTYDFEKCVYIAYTATPYANILNENPNATSIYPDFIQSLDKSPQYFGTYEIHGFPSNSPTARLPIVYPLNENQIEIIKSMRDGDFNAASWNNWDTMKSAIAYFVCTAAIRRLNRHNNQQNYNVFRHAIDNGKEDPSEIRNWLWTSMLVNIHHLQGTHNALKYELQKYLNQLISDPDFENICRNAWENCVSSLSLNDFQRLMPNYGNANDYPTWTDLSPHIQYFKQRGKIKIIVMNSGLENSDDVKAYNYKDDNNRFYDDHAWIICGGNKISRGLTLPGLTVSYFERYNKTITVDTLTQMGRWFGYRRGYELLPRIWMPPKCNEEMKKIAFIEDHLHKDIRENFDNGYSPADPEHYQRIYSCGRKLSGRVQSKQELEHRGGLNYATKSLPKQVADAVDVHNKIRNFITSHTLKHRDPATYGAYSKIPLFENVDSTEIENLLQNVLPYYPSESQKSLKGLLRDIRESESERWDVVVGTPTGSTYLRYNNETTPVITNGYDFGDFVVKGGSPALVPDAHGGLKPSVLRLHIPYYANIESKYLNEATRQMEPLYANTPELWAQGHHVPEGVRNKSDSDYMARVFNIARKKNPILQFYIIQPQNNIPGLPANVPLISLAVYWPDHSPDVFNAYVVGYEAPRRVITKRLIWSKVSSILRRNGFPMEAAALRNSLLSIYPTAANTYNTCISQGEANGYPYYKIPGRDAYGHKDWFDKTGLTDTDVTEFMRMQFAHDLMECLRTTNNHLSFNQACDLVLVNQPKWNNLIPFTSGDLLQFVNQHPELHIVGQAQGAANVFWFA